MTMENPTIEEQKKIRDLFKEFLRLLDNSEYTDAYAISNDEAPESLVGSAQEAFGIKIVGIGSKYAETLSTVWNTTLIYFGKSIKLPIYDTQEVVSALSTGGEVLTVKTLRTNVSEFIKILNTSINKQAVNSLSKIIGAVAIVGLVGVGGWVIYKKRKAALHG